MSKPKTIKAFSLLLWVLIGSASVALAGTTFQQAVSHYKAGNYSQAVAEFKQIEASYPTNAMSHYYLALCYQSLGNRAEARQEFTLTNQYGDASLKGYAQTALKYLAASSGSTAPAAPSSATYNAAARGAAALAASMSGSAPTAPSAGGNARFSAQPSSVSEVLEFYTDWCHVCKSFEPVWTATEGRVSGVQFRRYNAEEAENSSLVQKYGVKAYPTLVYLDRGGKVLKNEAGCPNTAEDFAMQIRLLH